MGWSRLMGNAPQTVGTIHGSDKRGFAMDQPVSKLLTMRDVERQF